MAMRQFQCCHCGRTDSFPTAGEAMLAGWLLDAGAHFECPKCRGIEKKRKLFT